ncbi:hypothetical protein CsSME_00047951 [Camellia sinensis var. sinensis]
MRADIIVSTNAGALKTLFFMTLHQVILFLDWHDLDRGVAHLGQGVAQLSQVLSFQADVIVTLLAEALSIAEIITCRSALVV